MSVKVRPIVFEGYWKGYWKLWLILCFKQWGIALIRNVPETKNIEKDKPKR